MNTLWLVVTAIILVYIAVCFGKIAGKYGKNPILYGILSVISPVNLIICQLQSKIPQKLQSKIPHLIDKS